MPRKTPTASATFLTSRRRFNEAAARCRGKHVRDVHRIHAPRQGFNEAAARCRGKRGSRGRCHRGGIASMRPRPDAAENFIAEKTGLLEWTGFNEAAARCRGKHWPRSRLRSRASRFNEAAARCRGKRAGGTSTLRVTMSLQ